jgi:hypothetical protein
VPLEISEIAVRLAVGSAPAALPARSGGAEGASPSISADAIAEIVQTCVEEVLRVLRMSEER